MRRILSSLMFIVFTVLSFHAVAGNKQPNMIVTPFANQVEIEKSSTANVNIIVQNNAGVQQTITDIRPLIPENSLVRAVMLRNNCGYLAPGESCNFIVRLTSLNRLGNQNLNVSVCSFNGTLCSRIEQPIKVISAPLSNLFVFPVLPSIAAGTTQQFEAIGVYADLTTQDLTTSVTWSSSDVTKATISNTEGSEGKATGVAAGTATITAAIDGNTATSTLTVTGATLSSITILPVSATVATGNKVQFYAAGIYSDNTVQNLTEAVTWSSSDTGKATISNVAGSKGQVTGVAAGSSTITATFGAVSANRSLTVTSATLSSIEVTPTNPDVPKGTTQQFTATGIYSDNSVIDLTQFATWSTGSAIIAIVSNENDSKGLAKGTAVGSTTVNAAYNSVTGSTNINVAPPTLNEIDVSPINASIRAGATLQYSATGIYSDNSSQDLSTQVTWQSSNNSLAAISNASGSEGLATGLSSGAVTISATEAGVSGSTSLTVTPATLQSIAVTPVNPSVATGTLKRFVATGTYSDASTKDVTRTATWTSGNTGVAVISNRILTRGIAYTVGAGASTITATVGAVSGNTSLTVNGVTLTSIAVTPANASLPIDATQQYTATGTYSDLSTQDITDDVTWSSSNQSKATVSNAEGSQGLVTGVANGSATITAAEGAVSGSTTVNVFKAKPGDNLQGGVIACLEGGLNDLIAATADNSAGIQWGGSGTITNAQSATDGAGNTATIVGVLGAGTTYAAGVCDAYEIDSAGNTPCVGGNTCYNDWFLPAENQMSCVRKNRNQIGGFNKVFYWTSSEYSTIPNFSAWFFSFANSGSAPAAGNKIDPHAVRCVRLINAVP